eukprot:gnl/Chilomastix_cuspidata/341.p1 GENE.gnl/Chilomastix_cuspidata/341~~gnl/Chilomastix_cuspidata/341.p1  ORF type:complete len:1473 (-),score=376.04 gnl/Chilomastix_cuspidata/341:75-4352(-)
MLRFLVFIGFALFLSVPSSKYSYSTRTTIPLGVLSEIDYHLYNESGKPIMNPHIVCFWLLSNSTRVCSFYDYFNQAYLANILTFCYLDLVFVEIDGQLFDQFRISAFSPLTALEELQFSMGITTGANVGNDLTMGSETLVVASSSTSHVFLFKDMRGSWQLSQLLSPFDGTTNSRFGSSVSVGSIWLAVGAPAHSASFANQGAVFLYTITMDRWAYRATLVSPDPEADALFGSSVSLCSNSLLVGSPGRSGVGSSASGSVDVFLFSSGSWARRDEILPPAEANDLQFGLACALWDDTAAVSAADGSVHVFTYASGAWHDEREFSSGAEQACPLALEGNTLAIGSPATDTVSVLTRASGGSWASASELVIDGPEDTSFGSALDLAFPILVVGAPLYSVTGSSKGSVFSFLSRPGSGSWDLVNHVKGTTAVASLGMAVATNGMRCASQGIFQDTGEAYVLSISSDSSPPISAYATLSGPDMLGVHDIAISFLDADGVAIAAELSVLATFSDSADALVELEAGGGNTYTFSSSLPSDISEAPLRLVVSDLPTGNYWLGNLPLEVGEYRLPTTSLVASASSFAVVGASVEVTITLAGVAASDVYPIAVIQDGGAVPIATTHSSNGYTLTLPSPTSGTTSILTLYRCTDQDGNELSASVAFDHGEPTAIYVFPNAMSSSTFRVFFGILNGNAAPFKKGSAVSVFAAEDTYTAAYDGDNGWYYFDAAATLGEREFVASITSDAGPIEIPFSTYFSYTESLGTLEVGDALEGSARLLDANGSPVTDGRRLDVSFGARGRIAGIYTPPTPRKSFATAYMLTNNEIPTPSWISLSCGYLKTDGGASTLGVSGTNPMLSAGAQLLGFHWLDTQKLAIEHNSLLLTFIDSISDLEFREIRPSLRGQIFELSADPAGAFGVYSGLYPLEFLSDSVGATGDLRNPTSMVIEEAVCATNTITLDVEDAIETEYTGLYALAQGSDFLVISQGTASTTTTDATAATPFALVLQESTTTGLITEDTGFFLYPYGEELLLAVFLPENDLWTFDSTASPMTVSHSDYGTFELAELPGETARIDSLRIIGAEVPISSPKYGHMLAAPTVDGAVPVIDMTVTAGVLLTSYATFTVVHEADHSMITSGAFSLAFEGGVGFVWREDCEENAWFVPVVQSHRYNTYLPRFTTDDYMMITEAGALTTTDSFTELRFVEFGQGRYKKLRGDGLNLHVINEKSYQHMRTLLNNILPDASVTGTPDIVFDPNPALYDLVTAEFIDCGVASADEYGCITFRSNYIAFDASIDAFLDAGGNLLVSHDVCTGPPYCTAKARDYLGIVTYGLTAPSSEYSTSYVGSMDSPIAYMLEDPYDPYPISTNHSPGVTLSGVEVITVLPSGNPYAWVKETNGVRVAFTNTGHHATTVYRERVTEEDEMVSRAMVLWVLDLIE